VGRAPAPSLISSASLHAWVGEVYLRAGRVAEANDPVVHALARARERKERGIEACTLRLVGDIAMQRDPWEAEPAEAYYRQALALADELGMCPLQAYCHHGLGLQYGKLGRLEGARVELSAASELYRAMEMTFWLHPVETALAQAQGR